MNLQGDLIAQSLYHELIGDLIAQTLYHELIGRFNRSDFES